MTYERLKVVVAATLIMFIFTVGNVIAFGFLQKSDNYWSSKLQSDHNAIIPDLRTTISTNEENKDKSTSSQTPERSKNTTQTIVVHRNIHRRTHAS